MLKSSRAQGEVQGVLTYQKITGIFDNPQILYVFIFRFIIYYEST